MNEKISVIIPVYNVEQFLPRCLDSVIENSYRALEIICVDDGSTDGGGKILERYAKRDPRITVITQKNGGLSAARNAGMERASGKFVAFIDSDDWVHPQYFETLLFWQQKKDADVIICDFERTAGEVTYADFLLEELTERDITLEALSANKHLRTYVTGRLYRMEALGYLRFRPGVIPEDAIFSGELLCHRKYTKIAYISVPMYYYYQRPGSLVSQITGPRQVIQMDMFQELAASALGIDRRRFALQEAIRHGLSGRYMLKVTGEADACRDAGRKLRKCGRELMSLPGGRWKEKMKYVGLSHVPGIYRLLRILDDPSLLVWEKQLVKRT